MNENGKVKRHSLKGAYSMSRTRFDDLVVPLDHDWVVKYRLPCIDGFYSNWRYPVTLAYPTGAASYLNPDLVVPSEEEAALLSGYNLFRSQRWFTEHYIQTVIRQHELDLDSGVSHHFGKSGMVGWQYRVSTWRHGEFPHQYVAEHTARYWDLIDLLDKIEGPGEDWVQWKAENVSLVEAANASNTAPASV